MPSDAATRADQGTASQCRHMTQGTLVHGARLSVQYNIEHQRIRMSQ